MASTDELRAVRIEKLNILKEKGINPYPANTKKTHNLYEVKDNFSDLEQKAEPVSVAGRIMSIRGQGAILFIDLFDGHDRFQVVFKKDSAPSHVDYDGDGFDLFVETIDAGDFIEATGVAFITKSGQQSLEVKEWRILTKSILPIPDEFYGLKDEDERYRKRYLGLLLDQENKEIFVKKAKFWNVIRDFMNRNDFLEVETPTLETKTGGAEATPFKTYHEDFDLDVYLRISVGELWQKRLMSAGFAKVFEIGRTYRNEGSSNEHLQEFTNLEFYWAYADYEQGMDLVKDLYRTIATEVFGTTKFTTRGHTFDLADEWLKVDYVEEIKNQTGIDIFSATEKEMEDKLKELDVKYKGSNKERLTDSLWKYCRKNIAGPAFLINHPKLISPLSKSVEGDENKTQRFQVLLSGSEVGNGYSELNDPIEQKRRFEEQQKLLDSGDTEAMMKDEEFVESLEYGMPPACGFGFGERLFAFMVDKSIREVQLFPLMKPKGK